MNTIKLVQITVDARTGYRGGDGFDIAYRHIESLMNTAITDAGNRYPDYRSKFTHTPFYDEHDTEKVFADTWTMPVEQAESVIKLAKAYLADNTHRLSSTSYIKVIESDGGELELKPVSDAEKLAQKYIDKSPALFTKAIHRLGNHTFFGDRDAERRMKQHVSEFFAHSYGYVSVHPGDDVKKFTLLTYVYHGVCDEDRKEYIAYARAFPDDVIIAEDYLNDRAMPKDLPFGTVSKADFLEAYWKIRDERERRR